MSEPSQRIHRTAAAVSIGDELLGGKPLDVPGSLNTVAVRYAGDLMTN